MKQRKELGKFVTGLTNAYASVNAKMRTPYSWVGKVDGIFVISIELDHKDKVNNKYNSLLGTFIKKVNPLRDAHPNKKNNAQEMFDAISYHQTSGKNCYVIFTNGTSSGSGSNPRGVVDGDGWRVNALNGDVDNGFSFEIERVY